MDQGLGGTGESSQSAVTLSMEFSLETTELVFYLGCCAVRNGTLPQVRVQIINGFSFVQLQKM